MADKCADGPACTAEITRLNKIIKALTNRAERSTNLQGSDFSMFQTTIMLEEQVRRRTAALEAALRENEKINRALGESEAKFHSLVNQSLMGIAIIENGKFSYSNPKFDQIFGYSAEEMRMLGPLDVTAESQRRNVAERMERRLEGEVDEVDYLSSGLRKDGSTIDIEIHGSAMNVEGRRILISLVLDVTQRVRADREIRALKDALQEQATHDPLTGLYNRRYLEETLSRDLIRAGRQGACVSAVMGDLDHFKSVNDRYGHLAGDEVLRVFGGLMKRHSRASDIYCRYGGEEFLLVLPGMTEQDARHRAEQLRSEMAATPVTFGTTTIAVTASFGVATFPHNAKTGDALISAADKALYAAKMAGRNQVAVSSSFADGCQGAMPLVPTDGVAQKTALRQH